MTNPEYILRIHRRAEKELGAVSGDEGDELLERLRKLKDIEQPTDLGYVKQIEDHDELFAVRVEGYRAIATLNKPAIRILLVDTRKRVYDRLDVAKERGHL